jgi:hypothetical protein
MKFCIQFAIIYFSGICFCLAQNPDQEVITEIELIERRLTGLSDASNLLQARAVIGMIRDVQRLDSLSNASTLVRYRFYRFYRYLERAERQLAINAIESEGRHAIFESFLRVRNIQERFLNEFWIELQIDDRAPYQEGVSEVLVGRGKLLFARLCRDSDRDGACVPVMNGLELWPPMSIQF